MILYHGTNTIVRHPEVRVSGYNKDFGFGFYCTQIERQARRWALTKRTRHIDLQIILWIMRNKYFPDEEIGFNEIYRPVRLKNILKWRNDCISSAVSCSVCCFLHPVIETRRRTGLKKLWIFVGNMHNIIQKGLHSTSAIIVYLARALWFLIKKRRIVSVRKGWETLWFIRWHITRLWVVGITTLTASIILTAIPFSKRTCLMRPLNGLNKTGNTQSLSFQGMRKSELNTKGHSNKQNVGRTHSDMDCSWNIGEIDAQLYEKYGLGKE